MIWCVEDDAAIREIEVYALKSAGFDAEGFENGSDFFETLKATPESKRPALIVLDVMLPEIDGIELLRRLKSTSAFADIPVIMATAKGTEYDKIKGLDLGADYYLTKPFGVMEFISCVKAVLRRCAPKSEKKILTAGNISLNAEEHTVFVGQNRIDLTYKEFELLRMLMSHRGIVFSREQIMGDIWGTDYCGETRTVDMHIKTLRQKLGDCAGIIKTVRNVGYKLEAEK